MSLAKFILSQLEESKKKKIKEIPSNELKKQQYKQVFEILVSLARDGIVKDFSQSKYARELGIEPQVITRMLRAFKRHRLIEQLPSPLKNKPQSFKILSSEYKDNLIDFTPRGKFRRDNMKSVLKFLKENSVNNKFSGTAKEIGLKIGLEAWNVVSASKGLEEQGFIKSISHGGGFPKTYVLIEV